jgi:hypothetical protein
LPDGRSVTLHWFELTNQFTLDILTRSTLSVNNEFSVLSVFLHLASKSDLFFAAVEEVDPFMEITTTNDLAKYYSGLTERKKEWFGWMDRWLAAENRGDRRQMQ